MSMAERTSTPQKQNLNTDSCFESVKQSKSKRSEFISSGSSSNKSDEPSLLLLKSDYVQRKVDKRMRE